MDKPTDRPCLYRNAGFWKSIKDCVDCNDKCGEYLKIEKQSGQAKLAKAREIKKIFLEEIDKISEKYRDYTCIPHEDLKKSAKRARLTQRIKALL